jgi:hypothetical protein
MGIAESDIPRGHRITILAGERSNYDQNSFSLLPVIRNNCGVWGKLIETVNYKTFC